MKKFPYTITRSEVKRIVYNCRNPHLRVGQAVCNAYSMGDLEQVLWENNDFDSVITILCNHFHKPDYQNNGNDN